MIERFFMSDNKTLKYDELDPEEKAKIDYALEQLSKACIGEHPRPSVEYPEKYKDAQKYLANNPKALADLPKQYRPR